MKHDYGNPVGTPGQRYHAGQELIALLTTPEPITLKEPPPFEIVTFAHNRRWCTLQEWNKGFIEADDPVLYRRCGVKKQKKLKPK